MELTKELKDTTAEILAFNEPSSSGEACSFIDMENGWGLKCYYDDKNIRDMCYDIQKYLASIDMAPQVGKKFQLDDYNGDSWYCFVTETAETLVGYGINNSHVYCEDADMDEDDYDEDKHNALYCRAERDEWIAEIKKLTDYLYIDDHAGNFGWIVTKAGDRKLVAIDFDTCTYLYQKILKGIK